MQQAWGPAKELLPEDTTVARGLWPLLVQLPTSHRNLPCCTALRKSVNDTASRSDRLRSGPQELGEQEADLFAV